MSAEATYAERSVGAASAASNLPARRARARVMSVVLFVATILALLVLAVLIWTVVERGWSWLRPELFENRSSRRAERAGLLTAILGTLWVISLTAAFAIPVGVLGAIYL